MLIILPRKRSLTDIKLYEGTAFSKSREAGEIQWVSTLNLLFRLFSLLTKS